MKLFGSTHKKSGAHSAPDRHRTHSQRTLREEIFDDYDADEEYEEYPVYHTRQKRRWPKVVIIVLAVIAALGIGGYAALSVWIRPPEMPVYTAAPKITDDPGADATEPPDGEQDTPEPTEDPKLETGYGNENRYTFLLLGKEPDGFNTDTIITGTFDVKEQWLHVVSIPRDTLVNVPWGVKRINSVYSMSKEGGYDGWEFENGIDGLRQALGDIMGYEPAFYAVVDIVAFEKLVDAIGGVTFDVPCNMNKTDPPIHFQAGVQHLSGEDALKVLRYRDYVMGDIDRIGVQQSFLKTVAEQTLTLGNIPNIGKVFDIYDKYVETNLSSGNIAWFLKEFLKLDKEDITFQTMPGDYSLSINGNSLVGINTDEWLEIVNRDLSPLEREITVADVDIMSYSDQYGYSSTRTR